MICILRAYLLARISLPINTAVVASKGNKMRKSSSPKMTERLAAMVKALLAGTSMNHAQIAAHFGGLNQGRVSEVKTGKRFAWVKPCSLEEALHG